MLVYTLKTIYGYYCKGAKYHKLVYTLKVIYGYYCVYFHREKPLFLIR